MTARDILARFDKLHVSVIVAAAAFSAVGGAALGAKLAIDKLGDQLRKDADEALRVEIEKSKEFYKTLHKKEEFETPEQALEKLHPEESVKVKEATEALLQYAGNPPAPAENLVEVTQNVFTDAAYVQEPFDYDKLLRERDPDRPYLITEEEYLEGGPNYEQASLTYYSGDGVLADDNGDEVIPNSDQIVGDENLMRFGHGSNDPNIVFVRNVDREMDYEISQSPGKYAVEVLDFSDEETESIQHSYQRPPRRFRDSDD